MDAVAEGTQRSCNALFMENLNDVKETNISLITTLSENCINESMNAFAMRRQQLESVFKVIRLYMEMVQTMLQFLRAVRTTQRNLSLAALKSFTKFSFALDRQSYARMIPLYLSEMQNLQFSDPATWQNFVNGTWVVNKNKLSFSSLGADEALEQENRRLKVQGGIVGITLNGFSWQIQS